MGGLPVGVSPVCLGLVGDPRVVPAAFDAGVNFFFVTADMHWPLYEKLRRGLELLFERGGGVRDEVVVGVVSYVTQPEFCHAPFHEVVAAIKGLERVDLAIAGGAYAADLLVRLGEYRAHQPEREPASRAIGASFHDRRAGVLALNHGLIDIGFLRYNPLHRGAEEEVFPQLSKGSPALLYNFKSTHGYLSEPDSAALGLGPSHWRPHITDYYRYALSRPEMDGILCALNEPEQVTELIDALERGALNEDQTQYLNDLAELALGRASLATPPD
jgi:hypothetical protein